MFGVVIRSLQAEINMKRVKVYAQGSYQLLAEQLRAQMMDMLSETNRFDLD